MLVYTSYDGDLITKIDNFIAFALYHGYTPLNPTKLLGYYISTVAHGNSKKSALEDCISVEQLADEFWLFVDSDEIQELPEGVIMELIFWVHNNNGPVRIIKTSDVDDVLLKNISSVDIDKFQVNPTEYFSSFNQQKVLEIANKEIKINDLRETVFIDLKNKYSKYIDWIKLYAFSKKLVPIDVSSAISELMINTYSKRAEIGIEDEIKTKVSNVVKITEYESGENLWSLKEAGVPKFSDNSWAITDSERTK
ncbi:hypothetical protein [Companilactobacillus metriopterae]|uniref:hypothetical protein n=1 Tax=Companilactobacillus metriopterae TaxID=1909267 RepID=UPI00100A833E|nr:hypothetical protein [Companilactobacillus metriopterae]